MELGAGKASHVVVGGGVLGLSAAWRLAERGADVLVLEKGLIGCGASGAAGGIVRNYYRSPAITDIIRMSVDLFEAEAEEFGFRQVGYAAAVPPGQVEDLVAIREQHERAGYESELIVGAEDCRTYLAFSWPDWEAEVAAVLHERRGGWADPMQTVRHLADRARAAGAVIEEGVEVTGFELGAGAVEAVQTSGGSVGCETLVAAPGPWVERLWRLLGLRPEVGPPGDGDGEARPLIAYWKAQEGEFALPGVGLGGRAGPEPPVVHLDQAGRASLRPRRARPPPGPLGDLPADGQRRHRGDRRRPAGAPRRARCSTRTAPTTPSTRRGRSSASSSPQGSPRRSAASAARRPSGG